VYTLPKTNLTGYTAEEVERILNKTMKSTMPYPDRRFGYSLKNLLLDNQVILEPEIHSAKGNPENLLRVVTSFV
jgi:hypothetical protein